MAKKRFYGKSEGMKRSVVSEDNGMRMRGGSESRRGIISADKNAISNLPQDVEYYESSQPRWGNDVMSVDGTTRTIYDQVGADGMGLARNKSKTRF